MHPPSAIGDNPEPMSEIDDEGGAPAAATAGRQPSIATAAPEGRPPTVLQVLPSLEGGGVERGTVDVAVALVEAGWGSVVASAGGAMVRELARHRVAHVTLPLHSKNPLVMRRNIARLRDVIRRYGVDIVHARSRAPAWSARAAARRAGVHFVTTFHGTYGASGGLKRLYNGIMVRGERVIAISDFIARHTIETYRADPARLRVIHRGVDLAVFRPEFVTQERMIDLATRWKLPDDRPIVLLPGRFSRWKGHALMIEALARIGRDDLLCVMVGADTGSDAYIGELTALAKRRGVESRVRFVDFCRDMPAAYMLSDAVVSASLRPEAFGRTLAEGLALGRPVVGPAHGGALEIIEEGRTGWLFTPGNPESLAAALDAALSVTPEARRRLAAEAMRFVGEKLSKTRMCADTLAVYAEVLDDAPVAEGAAAPAAP